MGAQGKPWSQAPFHGAHNTLYLCWRVCHSLELWFHTVGLLHTMLYLYPSCDGIPTVNSCHLIQAADKKKNKVDPKEQLELLHAESNGIPQTNCFLPQHTDPVLLKSICRFTSSRWLHCNRETVKQTKGEKTEKNNRSCKD